jgi:antitoxin component YwqK of YwqJK toxin-antitoxin module
VTDGEYLDGEKHGPWTTYYANGNKRSEGQYDRGKKVGPWTQYWPNGNKSEGTFREGVFTGTYRAFHENGALEVEGVYNEWRGASTDGTKEGPWTYFQPDGVTPWRRITYHRGARSQPDEIYGPRS